MSPPIVFELETAGANNYASLLEVVGIEFTKDAPAPRPAKPPLTSVTTVSGQLISSHGTFPCQLVTCRGKHHFYVIIPDQQEAPAEFLTNLKKAFDGYILDFDPAP